MFRKCCATLIRSSNKPGSTSPWRKLRPPWADSGKAIKDKFAVRRTDTQAVLGVVGKNYEPLQNRDAFAFFDGVFGKDQAHYECAGVLGEGERRIGHADFRISAITRLARELECDDASNIALQRQHLQIEHQSCVVGVGGWNSHRSIEIGQ